MQKELIYICLSLALVACTSRMGNRHEIPAIGVHTMVIQRSTTTEVNRYVGVVESIHETPLSLQTAGRVLSVACKNGDRVRRGQILLRVDSTQAVNAMRSAEAALRYAEDGYNRLKQVHGAGAVTDQKMVETESQLVQARSLYDAARRQVKECELTAPCDGVVSGLDIAVGQMAVPGLRLLTLLDLTAYQVRFTVPEAEIGAILVGQQGEMECTAVQRFYPIQVTDRGLTANRLAHTYEVTARIDGGQQELRPGMVGKVCISSQSLNSQQSAEIVVPAQCILMKPQGASIWIARDGKAERVMVSVGGYRADGVYVTSGLNEGDTIIIDGYQKLFEGCSILFE